MSAPGNKHRVAIVGTGNIITSHMRALQTSAERLELVAAVDLNEERVCQVCEQYHIPHWYTSVTTMLAEQKPDLVCILTPPATHLAIITECLEAGAWVYCEKPLCRSLAEFDAITEAENRTGRYVSTVFQWRFASVAKHIKKLVETDALGKPMVMLCNTMWYRTQAYYDVAWRGKYETEVGGPTMTLGIHLMDLFLWLIGEWEEVRAMAATLDHQIEVEDVSMALVRFANGSMGSIVNSTLSPRQESYMRLDFQKATLECKAMYRHNNDNWSMSLPDRADDPETLAHWSALTENNLGSHDMQLSELLDSMEANERPLVSGDEARRILEFAASLYKSAFTGQPVHKGDITPDDPFYYAMNGSTETA
ncbi:Gfo/Idh/MocA family oxidoreductase [Phototrophicus methaneseepsis]|uniref:Gfo/Idh/MocA family oxidoreductase n=1 Tax=Phototrophicus methaneseepsis TaxID=2710758 RepID=A0A7S8EBX0_9CHLR|nr:Gfo/Idh/MocA family oxidoreductase [Phototrophicus methaneseepsis]QPC84111.1 Gfo/Idh/MocA family oxidoreductase [Phototrophicus methaneseepsis]